jgi:hypothetical protein
MKNCVPHGSQTKIRVAVLVRASAELLAAQPTVDGFHVFPPHQRSTDVTFVTARVLAVLTVSMEKTSTAENEQRPADGVEFPVLLEKLLDLLSLA